MIVATRDFEILNRTTGEASVLQLVICAPVSKGDDWTCAYSLGYTNRELIGIDSLQALTLCLKMIKQELQALSEKYEVTFLGQEDAWL